MNFLLGGRMGDLIHSLWVVKNTPGEHTLFVTDKRELHSDGFMFDLGKTIAELQPILMLQKYVRAVKPYNDEPAENLSLWRRHAYSTHWTQLLANTFNRTPNGDPWLEMPDRTAEFRDKIIIHCSANPHRKGHHWNIVLDKYQGQIVFVGTISEYMAFGYEVSFQQVNTLHDLVTAIASCKFFIGNQSCPLAIAHALGVPRLAMLNEVDKLHYVGEEKLHKDFYWMAQHEHYYEGLNF